ncbi:MAG: tetratricopeptide repeat protein, partial [Promethearchaeota archaeon]
MYNFEEFEELLQTAQSLWKNRKIKQAAEAFEKVVNYAIDELLEEDQSYYLPRLSSAIYRAIKEQKQSKQYKYLVTYLELLVKVNELLDDPFHLSQSLIDLGRNLTFIKKFQKAEECFERALTLVEDTNQHKMIVSLCSLLLELHQRESNLRNLTKARTIFETGEESAQLTEATWSKAKFYKNIALLFKEEDPEFSITQGAIAAETYQKLGTWLVSRRERNYKQINNSFEQAFQMAKFSSNLRLLILTIKDYLKLTGKRRHPSSLREYIDEFDKLWNQSEIYNEFQSDLIELGEIIADLEFKKFHNLRRAIELYEEALKYSQQQKDLERQSMILISLSDIRRVAGELEQSLKHLMEAENIADTFENTKKKANCTKRIAHVYRNFGDYIAAARKYEKALGLNPQDENLRSECLTGLSHVYSLKDGNYERALELRKQAIQFSRKRIGYKMILSATCSMLLRFNAFKEVKAAIHELKELEQSLTDASVNFHMRGLYYFRLGRYDEAHRFLTKSLDLGKELDDRGYGKKWKLFPQEGLINCLIALGRFEEAENFAREALTASLEPPIHYRGAIL